jgi:hypothetical protein
VENEGRGKRERERERVEQWEVAWRMSKTAGTYHVT